MPAMPDRPSALWKRLPPVKRVEAAAAFWRDTDAPDIQAQHIEASLALAKRLKFRIKSIQGLDVERRAKHLAQMPDVSDPIATRALIAYHFAVQRPLMAAFLDALGIAHEDGLITGEDVPAPTAEAVAAAATTVKAAFPADDLDLYLRTLATLDGDTWANVSRVLGESA
jgi:hypothetical protein